ncbi:acyl-CoA dehydrogenase family protein [Microbacterium esteraromaticum]|uniref:acyl-CoA dehydrogenase family protein n=1 Tax=Microbacterium esteraromaticum TaxID=57043 RepID=UPI0019D3C6A6|nr:acyl-CoA dehydrogenase family protein [Microbacterium esteraromaticum]MBN7794669.1 acyl-CoA dehydrogenase family protein [Microbacterium esteraromaticum]
MSTHQVFNQAPPRVDLDEYTANVALGEGVARYDAGWAEEALRATGLRVGTAQFQDDARRANRHKPELCTHDRWGHRIDEVDYDPAYHRIISAAVADGAHTSAVAEPRPGANVARAATFMLYAQIEPGHACPVSMTHSAVPVIEQHPHVAAEWMPRLLSRSYDGRLVPGKQSALFGMAMTEKQGGSDVRANTTVARPIGDGRYELTGHKWFCSAPMSDAFLVLAQAPGGLSCFLVPRLLDDDTRNAMRIMRLKDKLGNAANASSEVEYDGAIAHLIGGEGRGVSTIIEMVTHTRLDCILGSVAGMRQSVAEAAWHARHRLAFDRTLIDQPAMTAVIADLQLETEGATAAALRLARAYDRDATAQDSAFARLGTAVMKYWACKRGPAHTAEALECLGGNGYTEDFPLAMRYREQPVLAVWEGSGNVIALDVLRALGREPEAFDAFDAEVSNARGADARLDAHLDRTRTLVRAVGADDAPQRRARALTSALALALQGALLVQHAPSAVADGFVGSRLGDDAGGFLFGALPTGADAVAIAARA